MVSVHRPPVLLELDLTIPLVEVVPNDPIGALLARRRPRLRTVLRTLHEAGEDSHVRGLLVKVGRAKLSWALMHEVRAGLLAFAASGKPLVAWAESLGDGTGAVDYVLATGCPEIWLQPTGELGPLGIAAEATFLRGALDKLGVEPQFGQRKEYKNAADQFLRTEFTPAHREAVDRVVESSWESAVDAVAAARSLPVERVRELADGGPLSAPEALSTGLVDRLGYRDEVYASMRSRVGTDARLLFADQWQPRRRAVTLLRRPAGVVALVEGRGEITSGRSRYGPGGTRMGSDTVSAALRAARRDDKVRSVLFRVDSPGGSAVASDAIWREVVLTREAGKPVVVSMGAVAGSGGYYVSCAADAILAQPSTITGSIGVLGGKLVITGLLERLGVGTGAVSRGSARMYSARSGFTPDDWAKLDEMLDRVYDDFVGKVADGRAMSVEAVEIVARGRIWSGADALRNGLIDRIGGVRDAAALARQKGGLKPDAPIRPALNVSPIERLRRPVNSEDPRVASASVGLTRLDLLDTLLRGVGTGPLLMPDVRLI